MMHQTMIILVVCLLLGNTYGQTTSPCPAGTYSESGMTPCKDVPAGQYPIKDTTAWRVCYANSNGASWDSWKMVGNTCFKAGSTATELKIKGSKSETQYK